MDPQVRAIAFFGIAAGVAMLAALTGSKAGEWAAIGFVTVAMLLVFSQGDPRERP